MPSLPRCYRSVSLTVRDLGARCFKTSPSVRVTCRWAYYLFIFYFLTSVVFRNNETLKDELAAFKKQNVLLMQEVELLKEQVGKYKFEICTS